MGSGKTSVGRLVADRLGLPLVDVDDAVRARTGHSVQELWEEGGEDAYRPLEREVVVEALRPGDPHVLAAPGGVVVDPVCMRSLSEPHVGVVYLRSDPAVLADRVMADPQPRPLLGTNARQVLADQHAARDERYASLADVVVPIDLCTVEQAAELVLGLGLVAPAAQVERSGWHDRP